MSGTYYAEGQSPQVVAMDSYDGGHYVLCHGGGIASRGIAYGYAVVAAPVNVYMIESYGG